MENFILFKGLISSPLTINTQGINDLVIYVDGELLSSAGYNITSVTDTSVTITITFLERFVGKMCVITPNTEQLQFVLLHDVYGEQKAFEALEEKLKNSFTLYMTHLSQGE